MTERKILALSSSRVGDSKYLERAVPMIKKFLGGDLLKIAFIPFASVDSYGDYFSNVASALSTLPYKIDPVLPERTDILDDADVIMVGGGNTFKLLHDLYSTKIIDLIGQKINSGVTYIGWSAGSNILSPTLCTTNDMPVIEPESFKALGLFKFQINPHYYNLVVEGFNGETRDQRLIEFIKMNPGIPVVCLPEGTALIEVNNKLQFIGDGGILLKADGKEIIRSELKNNEDLSFLL